MNVEDARALANKSGRDEKISKAIQQTEEQIKEACKRGENHITYGLKEEYGGNSFYIDGKYVKLPEVREHFIKQGFVFKDTGYIGGVYQHTERLCW